MPASRKVPVRDLALDLKNFRTIHQESEVTAVEAMIATSPDRFWALADSLHQDGYLPTEHIIVLKEPSGVLRVKEGNRRVAVLKLLHGIIPIDGLDVPANIAAAVISIPESWATENESVPCTIFDAKDAATVDRIVRLAHGKGEKAGRDQWNTVARARHNRDHNGVSEPSLDLLEKYLDKGKNVTADQKSRWSGMYPITALEDAMKKLAPRLGSASAPAMATQYPSVPYRDGLERIIHDIGLERLRFDGIRNRDVDFAAQYGIPPLRPQNTKPGTQSTSTATAGKKATKTKAGAATTTPGAPKAVAVTDPKGVRKLLREFTPLGNGREKLVNLRDEAIALDLAKTPFAFCFVLRSMFEVSAKAYCQDHRSSPTGPKSRKPDGQDRHLVDVLRDITTHLTKNKTDKEKVKLLHGAMTELGKHDGILSVTSMNQLVHNPRFSVVPREVAVLFSNILPLLIEMNS